MMGTVISVPSMGAASILLIPRVIPPPQQRNQTHQGRQDRVLQPSAQPIHTVAYKHTQAHAHSVNTASTATLHENWLSRLIDD